MATKADRLTVEQRVEAVYRLILDGWTQEQILLYRMCHNTAKMIHRVGNATQPATNGARAF